MISIDKALLRQLLLIERPWEVRDYRLDVRKRRCDVWIGQEPERGWFGRPKSAPAGELAAKVCQPLVRDGRRYRAAPELRRREDRVRARHGFFTW